LLAAGTLAAVCLTLSACSGERESTTTPQAVPPPAGSVWVADEGRNSLSVIDAAANSVKMTITGIPGPHNVQADPDGAVVYATSSAGVVVAIDPATYRVTATAPTGSHPAHVIEAPNGKVYVTNAADGTVSVYQGKSLNPAGRIQLGGMPHGMRPAAGGSVIVVANMMNGAVDLIDPSTDKSAGAVPVGTSPVQVAVSTDGRYAYTGISDPPSVVKIDLADRKVIGTARVPSSPVQLYLTPDEKTVLSADQGRPESPGHTLSVIDTAAMNTRGTVTTGAGPHGVVIDTSGNWAWVTNSYDSTVSAVDLSNLSVLATIAVGAEPNGISYPSLSPRPQLP
jgi:YVTN family beta-propeller protein